MPLSFDPIAEARRQWDSHGWGATDAMSAVTSLTRANQILIGRINELLRPFGLNFSRYEALVLLAFSRAGELPLGKMGERLMVHPTSVTNTIDRLEQDGLVERAPHPVDRRAVLAQITDDGRAVTKLATDALVEAEFGVDGIAPADLPTIDAALAGLRRAAGDFVD